jgi:hypothetical protein
MLEYFLKFADCAEAETVLASIGIARIDGIWPCSGEVDGVRFDLDVLFGTGVVWRMSDAAQTDGAQAPQPLETVTGFYVNLLSGAAFPGVLEPYMRHPVTPFCQFAPQSCGL